MADYFEENYKETADELLRLFKICGGNPRDLLQWSTPEYDPNPEEVWTTATHTIYASWSSLEEFFQHCSPRILDVISGIQITSGTMSLRLPDRDELFDAFSPYFVFRNLKELCLHHNVDFRKMKRAYITFCDSQYSELSMNRNFL